MIPDRPVFFVSPYTITKLAPRGPLPPIKSTKYLKVKSKYMIDSVEGGSEKVVHKKPDNPVWKKINGS